MKNLSLFLFIDALGWELIERFPHFLASIAPMRKRLKTIFGYSSACDPSIISGKLPSEHGLWSSFFYSPSTSPFKSLQWMKIVPSFISDHHRVRSRISRYVANRLKYSGYLQLYHVPFTYLPYFDYAEKRRIYAPHGLPKSRNIFDELSEKAIPYHMCAAASDDLTKINRLIAELEERNIAFGYLTLGQLDALMHKVGTIHPKVAQLLDWYELHIERILCSAQQNYRRVDLYIFSDHGMHDTTGSIDLQREIESTKLVYGEDYVAIYDSTMARFWFLQPHSKKRITERLEGLSIGHILSCQELKEFGVFFPDHRYGELIFLLHSGVMIAPSFMGHKQVPGMHGYHPNDAESYASILSNCNIPNNIGSIHHIFSLMQIPP